MVVTPDDLDMFVQTTDRLGGVGTEDVRVYWRGFRYRSHTNVNQDLDPLGDVYLAQMLRLYAEISGRALDQSVNELTTFDLAHHVNAVTPYSGQSPSSIALHFRRLSTVIGAADLPSAGRVLDMGCGWGASSELLAQLDLTVTAVDINPTFVELVSRRASRLNLPIRAEVGNFDEYEPDGLYHAVLFYESLHHAIRPHRTIERLAKHLIPGHGAVLLAGEPIQDIWWRHWGLRLDPLSVYCMRKFGWFESGWSVSHLKRIMQLAGLHPRLLSDADPTVGTYVVARN